MVHKRNKKQNPLLKKRIKRTIKQKAELENKEELIVMEELSERVRNARNYMYSRLAGINSYLRLQKPREIRNEWVKNKQLVQQFKLTARFWKITLEDVVANIKSLWSNACNKIKEATKENQHLTDDEKSYIRYVCSAPSLFGHILTRKPLIRPKKIEKLIIRETYIHNLIRRYARRYRGKTPYSYSSTFQLDADMYQYVQENGSTFIGISTHQKNKRIRLKCSDQNTYCKNIRVTHNQGQFLLAHTVETKQIQVWNTENEIGLDKGYNTLLVSSSGSHYGQQLHDLLSQETERLNTVNQKRNPYYAMVRLLEKNVDLEKADRIRTNNLGKKKYNRIKQKHDATVKSYINYEMNRWIKEEQPSKVGIEYLAFVSWDEKLPKHIKRKLSRWLKGFIDQRLAFKCELNGIDYIYVNPAYTSQECHICGCLGERKSRKTFTCKTCGPFHADENASKVIKNRLHNKEITLFTPYKKVKEILEKRTVPESALAVK